MSNCYYYAVTSKKTRAPIMQEHYLDYLDSLADDYSIMNVNFETTRGLHCHYMLVSEKPLDYKTLYKTKFGWSHRAVPIFNRSGWEQYIRKDFDPTTTVKTHFREEYIDPDLLDPRTLPKLF